MGDAADLFQRPVLVVSALNGEYGTGNSRQVLLYIPGAKLRMEEIEREAGISLSEVFLLYGQAGYRRIERRCLERMIGSQENIVLTVGGGIVSESETYNLLLLNCFTVWIKAAPDEHMARVVAQGDMRPMAGHAEATCATF